MNMFARFDENPAMTLGVIKETKRYGRTHGRTDRRTDGQRENSIPPTNKVCGGYNYTVIFQPFNKSWRETDEASRFQNDVSENVIMSYAKLTASAIKCLLGNLQSEAMTAISHKTYLNQFFNNGKVWIQFAYILSKKRNVTYIVQ